MNSIAIFESYINKNSAEIFFFKSKNEVEKTLIELGWKKDLKNKIWRKDGLESVYGGKVSASMSTEKISSNPAKPTEVRLFPSMTVKGHYAYINKNIEAPSAKDGLSWADSIPPEVLDPTRKEQLEKHNLEKNDAAKALEDLNREMPTQHSKKDDIERKFSMVKVGSVIKIVDNDNKKFYGKVIFKTNTKIRIKPTENVDFFLADINDIGGV